MPRKVICIATPLYPPQIGGPATHVAFLEKEFGRYFELRVVKFSSVSFLPKGLKHLWYFFLVLKNSIGADLVYALDPVSVGLPALCAAKILGKKFIVRIGGDYAWEQGVQRFDVKQSLDEFVQTKQTARAVRTLQKMQSFVTRHATVVIAPSEYLKRVIEMWGVASSRINVIYSQPEVAQIPVERSEARKKLGIHEDQKIILSAGRLVPWKGFEAVIEAVSLLNTRLNLVTRFNLVLAGSGPHEEVLLKTIENNNAKGYVRMIGQLPHEELQVWLAASDVFVLNSSYEGLSHSILEAFAARTPVIATDVGGNTELIQDGTTGLLVKVGDTGALSAVINRVVSDRALATTLTENAYVLLSRFNPTITAEALSSLFKTL